MSQAEQTSFAVGRPEVLGHESPAKAAGRDPEDPWVWPIAGKYDDYAKEEIDDYNPVVGEDPESQLITEPQARKAWLKAIDYWEGKNRPDAVAECRDIARELGWV
jgi:hypothetical protein